MSEETVTSASPPAPVKYARYRSVRQQAQEREEERKREVSGKGDGGKRAASEDVPAAAISRSMSRYRRSRAQGLPTGTEHAISPPQSLPPVPTLSRTARSPSRRVTEPGEVRRRGGAHARGEEKEEETKRLQLRKPGIREQEGQRMTEQKRRMERESEKNELLARTDEQLAEQKRKDLERLEAELDAAPVPLQKVVTPREKLGFFARRRAATKGTSPSSAGSGERKRSREESAGENNNALAGQSSTSEPQKTSHEVQLRAIEQGGGGIVPGIDAPMSAVNAGERRILIRCKQSSINLPITPETTPLDLIYSAANIMSQNITPSTAILLESYTQLGLERRIRRYERIRDIMNSWDRDTQNALILQNSETPSQDRDLDASYVLRDAPQSVSIYMYHSQKPGKWNKRYITLLSTGQIYISKKQHAKPSDKDVVNICHLSDFDIYTPTPQQLRKHLRPPKKYCHAIKSQQKTTMFLSTENFVHFFCSDEERLAQQWHDAVHEWRSWYLVFKKGEGIKKKGKGKTMAEVGVPKTQTGAAAMHKTNISIDESPYTIGTFSPLLSLDRFTSAPAEPDHEAEEEHPPRQVPFHLRNSIALPSAPSSKRERHPPPVAYRLPADAEAEFTPDSLLGRTYSQRQKAQREREVSAVQGQARTQAFVEGPSLLNGKMARPRTAVGSTGPLVDIEGDALKGLLRREMTGRRPRTSGTDKRAGAADGEGAFVKGGLVEGI